MGCILVHGAGMWIYTFGRKNDRMGKGDERERRKREGGKNTPYWLTMDGCHLCPGHVTASPCQTTCKTYPSPNAGIPCFIYDFFRAIQFQFCYATDSYCLSSKHCHSPSHDFFLSFANPKSAFSDPGRKTSTITLCNSSSHGPWNSQKRSAIYHKQNSNGFFPTICRNPARTLMVIRKCGAIYMKIAWCIMGNYPTDGWKCESVGGLTVWSDIVISGPKWNVGWRSEHAFGDRSCLHKCPKMGEENCWGTSHFDTWIFALACSVRRLKVEKSDINWTKYSFPASITFLEGSFTLLKKIQVLWNVQGQQ